MFYPIELMEKTVKELEKETKEVQETSDNADYVKAVEFVNGLRIIQLKSAIAFLRKAEDIPIVE